MRSDATTGRESIASSALWPVTITVGDLVVTSLYDTTARVPAGEAFPGASSEDWEPYRAHLDADGSVEFSIGSFLVRDGERVVLVDAGLGPGSITLSKNVSVSGGSLLDSLHKAGVEPDEVTDVIFGHLHFDHVGWASLDGKAVFPRATYRCEARDWAHFVPGDERVAPILEPIADQFEPFSGDGPLLPGIDTMVIPGHTPGNTVFVLSSGVDRALLLGDVVHCPVELLEEEWDGMGDVDPVLAKRGRNAVARGELEQSGDLFAAAHFPGMRFGRLVTGEARRSYALG